VSVAFLELSANSPACEHEACWGPHGRFKGRLYSKVPLVASFEYATVADMGLARFRASADFRAEPTGSKHSERYVGVVLQIGGTGYCEGSGGIVTLAPRHWAVVDEAKPPVCAGPSGAEALLLMIPRAKLTGKGGALTRPLIGPFSADAGIGRLAWRFIHSVFDELPSLSPQSEPGVVDTVCQLVGLAMAEFSGDRTAASSTQAVRERIKAFVLDHLRDPELNADCIAAALHCTKRYLHKAFEMEGVSVGDYIWGLRLDQCRDELLHPQSQGKSITEVAFSWGFSSSAHFSTAFKERFGNPPSSYRKEEGPHTIHAGPSPRCGGNSSKFNISAL